jgi:hypothetical protein
VIIRDKLKQGTLEWLCARAGVATASEFDELVTPLWKVKDGEGPKSFTARKVAEAWMGSPAPGFNSLDMQFGQILEEEARPFAEMELGVDIRQVGLVLTDCGRIGCSPDGLIGDEGGIEIKCPTPQVHTRYLLEGGLPRDYAPQVQGQLFVTGRPWWIFMSYCRGFPPLILKIERDEKAREALSRALGNYLVAFDDAIKRLTQLNGGYRPVRKQPEPEPTKAPEPAYHPMHAEEVVP